MSTQRTVAITLIISIVAIAFLAASAQGTVPVSAVTVKFAVNGITNYTSNIITIDGATYPVSDLNWRTFQWVPGETHTVTAYSSIRNTDYPSKNYTFTSWSNGNGLVSNSGTFTVPSSNVVVTANYVLATHVAKFAVTGTTNYSGNILIIDGVTYPLSDLNWRTFAWDVGTTHTVAVVTPIQNTDYPQKTYAFLSWSSGSGLSGTSGTITMPNNDITITATYGSPTRIATFAVTGLTQYTGNIIKIDGVTYPLSDLSWRTFAWDIGTTHSIEATLSVKNTESPQKGYTFSSWTNGNGLTGRTGTFTMSSSDVTVTANYVQSTVKVSFSTQGLSNLNADTVLTVDGTSYDVWNVPYINLQWDIGSTHTVTAANSIKGWDEVTHTFSSWTNGNGLTTNTGTFTTPNADVVVTANYATAATPTPTPTGTPTKPATTLTIICVNSTADRGATVTISGALTSGNCGIPCKTITLSYFNGASWIVISQTTTGSGGAYSYSWTIPQDVVNGQYPLKAEFAGDACYQGTSTMTGTMGNGGSLFVVPEVGGALGALGACIGSTLVYGKLRSKRAVKA